MVSWRPATETCYSKTARIIVEIRRYHSLTGVLSDMEMLRQLNLHIELRASLPWLVVRFTRIVEHFPKASGHQPD